MLIPVILNADDFGLSDGVCRAILELFEHSAISNTTIMVAAPESKKRIQRWGGSNLLGMAGLHLQLTGGKPISQASEVRSLIDPVTGNFLPRNALCYVDPVEVEREWNRQFEVAIELLGGLPTHLDSHHNVHLLSGCSDIFLSLASKYRLSVRSGNSKFKEKMDSKFITGSSVLLNNWTCRSLGVIGLKKMLDEKKSSLSNNSDVIEVITHPGYVDEYLNSISSLNTARNGDRSALKELAVENWLFNNGYKLVAYPNLDKPTIKKRISS